jgi:nucleoside 2-deoxyribosyltransferase
VSKRLYLSASIANATVNERLTRLLPAPAFEVVLPQTFTPDVPHAQLPLAIVERCLEEMRRCDAALLLLDAFGIDCAFEVGFLLATGRPVVGVAAASTRFTQHWMVKGGLAGVVCLDEAVFAAAVEDPIVGGARAVLVGGWEGLAAGVAQVLGWSA